MNCMKNGYSPNIGNLIYYQYLPHLPFLVFVVVVVMDPK